MSAISLDEMSMAIHERLDIENILRDQHLCPSCKSVKFYWNRKACLCADCDMYADAISYQMIVSGDSLEDSVKRLYNKVMYGTEQ